MKNVIAEWAITVLAIVATTLMLLIALDKFGYKVYFAMYENTPINEIKNCKDLKNMNKEIGSTYILMTDIDFKECLNK